MQHRISLRPWPLPVRGTEELERVGRCVEQAFAHRRVRVLPAAVMEADTAGALHAGHSLTQGAKNKHFWPIQNGGVLAVDSLRLNGRASVRFLGPGSDPPRGKCAGHFTL